MTRHNHAMSESSGPESVSSPTLAALRPSVDSPELPVHQRTIDMQVFEREGHLVVIGILHDQRPWASGGSGPRDVHRMELGIVVRRSDLVIVDAEAIMHTFPHAECPISRTPSPTWSGCPSPVATPTPSRSASAVNAAAAIWSSWPGPSARS